MLPLLEGSIDTRVQLFELDPSTIKLVSVCRPWHVSFVAATGQQQVQDQHVPRPPAAGRLPQRQQLHLCTHAGRAGEVGALLVVGVVLTGSV